MSDLITLTECDCRETVEMVCIDESWESAGELTF